MLVSVLFGLRRRGEEDVGDGPVRHGSGCGGGSTVFWLSGRVLC
jgi:hypothetical protein